MIIAAVAVLVGVFYAATGRGGELAYEHADHAPLDLGPVAATDVAMLRPPTALWGYNMQVTDEALETIARAMRDRDVTIAYLRQQLAGGGSDQALPADVALTPPTRPEFSLAAQTAEIPAASQTALAAEFPLPVRTASAPQVQPSSAGHEQPPGPKHARPTQRWTFRDPAAPDAPAAETPVRDTPVPAAPAADAPAMDTPAPDTPAPFDSDTPAAVEPAAVESAAEPASADSSEPAAPATSANSDAAESPGTHADDALAQAEEESW